MGVNFDEAIERRHTNCSKYDGMTASFGRNDLLPLWIADMDFPVPEAVTEAVKKRTEHPVYGYNVFPEGYYAAFAAWTAKHHNWSPDPSWVCHTPGVLTALSTAILAFTKPGDSVLIQPPVADIATMDFNRARDAIRAGYDAAVQALEKCAALRPFLQKQKAQRPDLAWLFEPTRHP